VKWCMSSGWYSEGYCTRIVSANESLKRVVMLLARLRARDSERKTRPPILRCRLEFIPRRSGLALRQNSHFMRDFFITVAGVQHHLLEQAGFARRILMLRFSRGLAWSRETAVILAQSRHSRVVSTVLDMSRSFSVSSRGLVCITENRLQAAWSRYKDLPEESQGRQPPRAGNLSPDLLEPQGSGFLQSPSLGTSK
jgi:hypothetical protein